MKLYIEQRVFTFGSKFDVWNEDGEIRYKVEGEIFTLGKKLHIYDSEGEEVAYVQQKLMSFLPKYFVFVGQDQVATIVKEFTFMRPQYHIEGTSWRVDGDFLGHDYSILDGDTTIAYLHKKWMSWGDCFEIEYDDAADEKMLLAVILAIDAVMDDNSD